MITPRTHPVLYISGKMTGMPDYNYPLFHSTAKKWRAEGFVVHNPAESYGGDTSRPRKDYIRMDIDMVMASNAVAVLPGWQESKGARLEVSVAEELKLPIVCAITLQPLPKETTLQEAQRLVHGARGVDYGHPLDDFTRTGIIWGAVLGIPAVPPEKVGLCMVGVKMSRECNAPKRDNRTDGEGYFETVDMVHEERERREKE